MPTIHAVSQAGLGRRWLTAGAAAVATVAAVTGASLAGAAPAAAAAAGSKPVVVAARPPAPAHATRLGSLAASRSITGSVALKPRDPAGLAATAKAITTKGSAAYRHYLPAGYFARFFGPTPRSIAAVEATLRDSGLDVTSVSSNGLLVNFRTTAAGAEKAFHTSIDTYRLAGGRIAFAPTASLKLPAAVSTSVQGVFGLSTVAVAHAASLTRTSAATGHVRASIAPAAKAATAGGPSACAAATADSVANGDITDTEVANAYGLNGLYAGGDTGVGQTIAVYELEPYLTSDVRDFDACYFGSAQATTMLSRLHNISVDGGQQLGPGVGEAALDVDDVSAMAPGATIDVYESPNTLSGLIDNYNQIVADDTAKVVTSSWDICESDAQTYNFGELSTENTIFEQAALQGQSVFSAAGDAGEDSCAYHATAPVAPVVSVMDPSSQPYVVGVGGTSMTTVSEPPQERTWNDGAGWGATAGGVSAVWAQPAWQAQSKVPGIDNPTVLTAAKSAASNLGESGDFCSEANLASCREVPDVSAIADEFTGITIWYEGSVTGFGGTSSAAPLWAGMLADINASSACSATHGAGFITPALYALASVPSEYAASFNDITLGNNDIYGVTNGVYPATTGYDMTTGLGTPRVTRPGASAGDFGKGLDFYLCAAAAATSPTVSGVSPQAVKSDGSQPFTIKGTRFKTGTTSNVAGVTVGSLSLPDADFTVVSPTSITVSGLHAAQLAGVGSATGGAGTYNVSVTAVGGATSALTSAGRVTFFDPDGSGNATPQIDGIGQSSGPEAGGQVINIYGSGLTGATGVTFGGVEARSVNVVDDNQLTVKTPSYSSAMTCLNGESPVTNLCQTLVQVTTSTGESSGDTSGILPQAKGDLATAPAGTEEEPALGEYDFLPTPHLSGVTLDSGLPLASELGGDVVTLTGKGLGVLGLDWVDVGPPNQASSNAFDITGYASVVYPTSITFVLPPTAPTTAVDSVPITVQTSGSRNLANLSGTVPPSNAVDVQYAPTPVVSSARTGTAYNAGPVTGGTALTIDGTGFTDPYDYAQFVDNESPGVAVSDSTQYLIDPNVAGTNITLSTPAANAGVDDVGVCGISGCSPPVSKDVFTYFPTGNPTVSSVSPSRGPAGETVTITGTNLGFARIAYFGKNHTTDVVNPPQYLDSGDPYMITAQVPPGTVGSTADVQVVTLESEATAKNPKSPVNKSATFTYTKAPTKTVLTDSVKKPKAGSVVAFKAVTSVSSGTASLSGEVVFKDNGKTFDTVSEAASGKARAKHRLSKGKHVITAVYKGTAQIGGSKATLKVTA